MNCVNAPKKLTEFSRLIGGIIKQSTIFSAKKSFAAQLANYLRNL